MATLSEDNSSWKASGIQRRDFRSTKNGPEIPKGSKRKKNTKKWCKGIEGREHKVIHWVEKNRWGSYVDKCENCGKEMKHYWKRFF
jgi:hypothetical protein